jgi:hypothetical protein
MNFDELSCEQASEYFGRKVTFNYGAMHGSEDGVIVSFRVSKWGRTFEAEIVEGENAGEIKHFTSFTTVGFGVYLKD